MGQTLPAWRETAGMAGAVAMIRRLLEREPNLRTPQIIERTGYGFETVRAALDDLEESR